MASFKAFLMHSIEVVYSGLIQTATARQTEIYKFVGETTVRDLFKEIIRRHGNNIQRYLLSDDCLKLAPGAAVFKNGHLVRDLNTALAENQRIKVLVLSPMMIGG
jgi:hypothetical protein